MKQPFRICYISLIVGGYPSLKAQIMSVDPPPPPDCPGLKWRLRHMAGPFVSNKAWNDLMSSTTYLSCTLSTGGAASLTCWVGRPARLSPAQLRDLRAVFTQELPGLCVSLSRFMILGTIFVPGGRRCLRPTKVTLQDSHTAPERGGGLWKHGKTSGVFTHQCFM